MNRDIETPSISSSAYTTSTIPLTQVMQVASGSYGGGAVGGAADFFLQQQNHDFQPIHHSLTARGGGGSLPILPPRSPLSSPSPAPLPSDCNIGYFQHSLGAQLMPKRMVQIIVADKDSNVPLEDSLLYKGDPIITDLEDRELWFEVNLKEALTKHNEKRTKMVNKLVKDRVEYLEPARVRDLSMVVVNIATFT